MILLPTVLGYKMDSAGSPFLPALPDSCTSSSSVFGVPKYTTLLMSIQSTPRPNAVVAINNRVMYSDLNETGITAALVSQ